jgi:hypothetical protein
LHYDEGNFQQRIAHVRTVCHSKKFLTEEPVPHFDGWQQLYDHSLSSLSDNAEFTEYLAAVEPKQFFHDLCDFLASHAHDQAFVTDAVELVHELDSDFKRVNPKHVADLGHDKLTGFEGFIRNIARALKDHDASAQKVAALKGAIMFVLGHLPDHKYGHGRRAQPRCHYVHEARLGPDH